MEKQITKYSQQEIENRIFNFRGKSIMIDRDLAEMYQVETKRLNEQVKRNIERFPEKFRFQLSETEKNELVAICDRFESLKHSSALPFAFTEQGVAMLSAVLKSQIAITISIQIIDAFVEMRKTIGIHSGLLQRMDRFEIKQAANDQKFEQIFKALELETNTQKQGVFFDGQVFDAYEFVSKIIRSAAQSLVLIDNYIDETTLILLSKKRKEVKGILLTKNISKQLALDVQKANEQYGNFKVALFATLFNNIEDTYVAVGPTRHVVALKFRS